MIRPAAPADAPRLLELTEATAFFRPREIETLRGVLEDYFAGGTGHACFVMENDDRIAGYVYVGVSDEVDDTWYIWWIAVDPSTQGRGAGRELLRFAEDEAGRRGARVMFVETSSLPGYDTTRRFYLKNGYDQEATLGDYYSDGDDLVIFRKRLAR